MKETLYMFKVDSQYRVALSSIARQIYGFEEEVYIKLQVVNGERYLQISGRAINFYQSVAKIDSKGRFFVPKDVRHKFSIEHGDEFESFEDEIDSDARTLLLKKVPKNTG